MFPVGVREVIHLKDCGRVALEPDEQVTFVTESGTEYDVVRKSWGYYATPSLNSRLPSFGLKSALVRSGDRLYLLLVEADKEAEFHAYLERQGMEVASWLDQVPSQQEERQKAKVEGRSPIPDPRSLAPSTQHPAPCFLCGSSAHALVFTYDAPPPGETVFPLRNGEIYHREVWRCQGCGHFTNRHQLDLKRLYEGGYVDATYSGDKLLATFRKIMALPSERSDNFQRVRRIVRYMNETVGRDRDGEGGMGRSLSPFSIPAPTLLDVGSGLCVFPARMKEEGWECTALDPDPRAVDHARQHVGVHAICGDFLSTPRLQTYDLITFNKVLEHVENPVEMLRKSQAHLRAEGVVYVELPDGEAAAADGAEREEFFIEHSHVFSMSSLCLLARQAGFSADCIERVHEPSTKYTLRAFLRSAARK
jgi:SAM-dependent methyltransferase